MHRHLNGGRAALLAPLGPAAPLRQRDTCCLAQPRRHQRVRVSRTTACRLPLEPSRPSPGSAARPLPAKDEAPSSIPSHSVGAPGARAGRASGRGSKSCGGSRCWHRQRRRARRARAEAWPRLRAARAACQRPSRKAHLLEGEAGARGRSSQSASQLGQRSSCQAHVRCRHRSSRGSRRHAGGHTTAGPQIHPCRRGSGPGRPRGLRCLTRSHREGGRHRRAPPRQRRPEEAPRHRFGFPALRFERQAQPVDAGSRRMVRVSNAASQGSTCREP